MWTPIVLSTCLEYFDSLNGHGMGTPGRGEISTRPKGVTKAELSSMMVILQGYIAISRHIEGRVSANQMDNGHGSVDSTAYQTRIIGRSGVYSSKYELKCCSNNQALSAPEKQERKSTSPAKRGVLHTTLDERNMNQISSVCLHS